MKEFFYTFYSLNSEEIDALSYINKKVDDMNENTGNMLSDVYIDKICGGVYGKIIGIRLGIPFECAYSPGYLQEKYKYIDTYPIEFDLTMPDDDNNGFVFFSKVFDMINDPSELTPEYAAYIILNYAWEKRGFFWNKKSTENIGYLERLHKKPIPAPGHGSDFVGGQLFYDAAGLVFAGEPEKAADCAEKLSLVMHAGEGRLGARFICACIAKAFESSDPEKIIIAGLEQIPLESKYAAMVQNVYQFYQKYPNDWKLCSRMISDTYNDYTASGCASHIVMALLYGHGIFSYSMEICLLSGGDTDCNCGNLGTILGAMVGYKGIPKKRWIDPINDVLYCSSALPYENDVSITEFSASLIRYCAKFKKKILPEYLMKVPEKGELRFLFPFSTQGFKIIHFREDENGEWNEVNDVSVEHNMAVVRDKLPVSPPSGCPYTLKLWIDSVKYGNNYRIFRFSSDGRYYQKNPLEKKPEKDYPRYPHLDKYEPTCCTKYLPGQYIQIQLFSRYNTCNMTVRFVFYSSMCGKDIKSKGIQIPNGKWKKMIYRIPDIEGCTPDCFNLEIIPNNDTYYHNGYDGLDLYIDDLKITGTPNMHFIPLAKMLNHEHSYPSLANFSIGIGDVYYAEQGKQQLLRFYSGFPYSSSAHLVYQELAGEKNIFEAFFGCPMKNVRITCNMQIAPPQNSEAEPDWCYDPTGSSMMIISAKGAADNFAVGFWKGKIGIFRCNTIPGEYTPLVEDDYQPDPYALYCMTVNINKNEIKFSAAGNDLKKFSYTYKSEETELSGYMGFFSQKNGFTLFDFTINYAFTKVKVR